MVANRNSSNRVFYGNPAAGGVAVRLLAIDIVGGPLVAAEQVYFGAAFFINFHRFTNRNVAAGQGICRQANNDQ